MTDISKTIIPKSDQLNSDDLITGEMTLVVTAVKVVAGDQPVHIHYEGDSGKVFKPCKSMRRVLVQLWSADGDKYVGRTLRVFRDTSVKWAGEEIGGIRISAMSHIENEMKLMLTVSKGKRTPYTIKPIITEPLNKLTDGEYDVLSGKIFNAETMSDLGAIGEAIKKARYDKEGAARISAVYKAALKRIRDAEITVK